MSENIKKQLYSKEDGRIHFVKGPKGFRLIVVGKNNEVLSSTEHLTTVKNLFKNLYAQTKAFRSTTVLYQDDTKSPSVVYQYENTGLIQDMSERYKPCKPYSLRGKPKTNTRKS
jgi:hypothetical protein